MASGSSPIWTNWIPICRSGTFFTSSRRANSTITDLGSSAGIEVGYRSNPTQPIKKLTGYAVSDDKDADRLVLESGILNPRNVGVQDLPEPGTSRCLACGDMSDEYTDETGDNLRERCCQRSYGLPFHPSQGYVWTLTMKMRNNLLGDQFCIGDC